MDPRPGWVDFIIAAGGGLVVFVVTVIIDYFKSRKGNFVVVTLLSETPQIQLGKDIGSTSLTITYRGEPVTNLVVTRLKIENQGAIPISPLGIHLHATPQDGECKVREIIELQDPDRISEIWIDGDEFFLKRSQLNPIKAYPSEKLLLSFISDKPLNFSVRGSDKSWRSKYKKRSPWMWNEIISPSLLAGGAGFILNYLFNQILLLSLLVFIAVVVINIISSWLINKPSKS